MTTFTEGTWQKVIDLYKHHSHAKFVMETQMEKTKAGTYKNVTFIAKLQQGKKCF